MIGFLSLIILFLGSVFILCANCIHSRLRRKIFEKIELDVRAPINGMLGVIELLDDLELSNEHRELFGAITEASEHILSNVDRIIGYKRIGNNSEAIGEIKSRKGLSRQVDIESLKVLVAEDDEMNQKIIARLLSNMGHDVTVVSNGLQAVYAATNENFDLIFMDMEMPVMGGDEAFIELRKKHSTKLTPVVAVTAQTEDEFSSRYLGPPMEGFLSKPIRKAQLKNAMNLALRG